MRRQLYLAAGYTALGAGLVGLALPIVPTVPFLILAAACFAKSSPELEARIVHHPVAGPHVRAWRTQGAISARGKAISSVMFAGSSAISVLTLPHPYWAGPVGVMVIAAIWVLSRPTTDWDALAAHDRALDGAVRPKG